jgi:hypothetical protein
MTAEVLNTILANCLSRCLSHVNRPALRSTSLYLAAATCSLMLVISHNPMKD